MERTCRSLAKSCGLSNTIRRFFYVFKINDRIQMEQYRLLAECLLPAHMLDWFDLQNVCVEKKDDTQVIHIYLDENEQKPDSRDGLRPNGFTRESVFHDFPIRGQEVLLHVRRRRWLDKENHNVMTECTLIQESTRCSTELADFLKDAFGDAPYNGPFVFKGLPHRWRRIRPCLQGPISADSALVRNWTMQTNGSSFLKTLVRT